MSMVSVAPEGEPLYGGTPYERLRMPVQCMAIVAARRHLFHEHGYPTDRLHERRCLVILRWHLEAHDLPLEQPALVGSMPWSLELGVHRVVEQLSG